jgi:hypothetical protein
MLIIDGHGPYDNLYRVQDCPTFAPSHFAGQVFADRLDTNPVVSVRLVANCAAWIRFVSGPLSTSIGDHRSAMVGYRGFDRLAGKGRRSGMGPQAVAMAVAQPGANLGAI